MPALGNDYQNAKPMDDYTPVPIGDYEAVITASEVKENKKKDGQYLQLTVEIVSGEHQGRIINRYLNLWHPSKQTVEIANRELATIVAAVDKPGAQNSEELHNILMIASVGIEPGTPWTDDKGVQHEGRPNNIIKNYKKKQPLTAPVNVETKPAPAVNGQPPINPATGKPYKLWEDWPGKGK